MLFVGPYAYEFLKRHGVPVLTIDENNTCQTDTQPAKTLKTLKPETSFIA